MSDLLSQARVDTRLSYRAKGLLDSLVHMHRGSIPPVRELVAYSAEGREAIRRALGELIDLGYVVRQRYQTRSGHWGTTTVLAPTVADFWASVGQRVADAQEPVPMPKNPYAGFLGTLPSTSGEVVSTYSSIDTSPNGDVSIGTPLTGRPDPKEIYEVGYDFLPKTSTDGEPDGVGIRAESADAKIARRNAKGKAPVKARPTDARGDKDVSRWNANDLTAEFASLAEQAAPGITGQVNYGALAGTFSRFRKDGVDNATLVYAVREFFADPARVAAAGRGIPMWRQFAAWFPTEQVRLEIASGTRDDGFDEALAEMAEQAAKRPRRF